MSETDSIQQFDEHDPRSHAQLEALLAASAAVHQSLDVTTTWQAIADSAARVLDAEASSVLSLSADRQTLRFIAVSGSEAPQLIGREMAADLGVAGQVIESLETLHVENVQAHPEHFGGFDASLDFVTRDLVAAPLRRGDEVIGVIEVMNPRGGATFSPRDVRVLESFANFATLAALHARDHERVKRENSALRTAPGLGAQTVIGQSEAWQAVRALCDRVAPVNTSVLLLGETGTGKEVCARTIHTGSARASGPFVAVNCAALPEQLLESELFGHEAGAFTGATERRIGRFELAEGGTLFLDEVGDVPAPVQVKLLRVLQEREFNRVGGAAAIRCDVRIIAATNRDLAEAVRDGTFRDDLFYRLNVFPITLPPLRERVGDVAALVEHFVPQLARELGAPEASVSPDARAALEEYAWPGNIRELRNVLERAVLLAGGAGVIGLTHLPPEIASTSPIDAADVERSSAAEQSAGGGGLHPVEVYERQLIVQALEAAGWNQSKAARALGVSRDHLRYRVKKYDLKRAD